MENAAPSTPPATERRVLLVEDDAALREALADTLQLAGYPVTEAENGRMALSALQDDGIEIVLTDIKMPRMDGHHLLRRIRAQRPDLPVVLMTAYANIEGAVAAMRDGASDYLVKPFEPDVLLGRLQRFLGAAGEGVGASHLVARDPAMREIVALARRAAGSGATIMITGASGTGKEVLARFIHLNSRRAHGPFVAINCAAIPDNMLEATLFGYEKGAFTGAVHARPGKFEQAHRGTLLLDEISELAPGLQAKVLRVIQEREVERLGARDLIPLDVRLLATSNRDLASEVRAGRFREDLYYRINVFPVHLLPLSRRPGDILPLAQHLIEKAARTAGRAVPAFSENASRELLRYAWPGNVRELENVLQRALILQPGDVIDVSDLHFERFEPVPQPPENPVEGRAGYLGEDLRSREQRLICETLEAVGGNRQAAAERLGLSPRTLRYKLAKLRAAGVEIPGNGTAP